MGNPLKKIGFEYKITIAYILIGGMWILFSDRLLNAMINDPSLLTEIQTYKGWFYVIITSLLFYLFLRNHLSKLRETEAELEKHKNNLVQLVQEKTLDLETLNEELKLTNDELHDKNEMIVQQNKELNLALTKLNETQGQLIQAEKMASLGTLTAGIAHEINNPLNYIMGAHRGLQEYFTEFGSKANERTDFFLNSIEIGLERTSNIIKGLNQFSRNNEIMSETCDIHSILDNCILMLGSEIKHTVKVEKSFATDSLLVKGNVGMLHQVFINVLSNAIDAINGAGTISILTRKTNKENVIIISDTGCGIEKEKLSRITDPFFTSKPAGKGTGLGLSISYSIIKEHKGSIRFDSELGKGTKVTINLPVMN